MPEVITIGETMVSLTPTLQTPMRYAEQYVPRIAGAESNTAVGLQKLGHSAAWVSRVGADELGAFLLRKLRAEGVDTGGVILDEARQTGIMFKENRSSGDPRVFYYRSTSAASGLSPKDLRPESFEGAKLLHLTGITPVLSDSCRETAEQALVYAKECGLAFSFDPNIRYTLWREERDVPVLLSFCLRADYVLLGLEEAQRLFGTSTPRECCDYLFKNGKADMAAVKQGANGVFFARRGQEGRQLAAFPCKAADTVGAGDSFNAGFLSGVLENLSAEDCALRGNAAGALAVQTSGDIEGMPERAELLDFLAGRAAPSR